MLIDTDASCITSDCHSDMGKRKFVHSVGVDKNHCNRCHEILKKGEHSFKKLPVETRLLCAGCHSENIKAPPDIKGSPPKVIVTDEEAKLHLPFAEGKCTKCHDAHESNFYKHLKEEYPGNYYAYYTDEAYALCFNNKCHEGLEKAFTSPRTLTETYFRNGDLNLHFRHVNKIKGRTCKACHHHHASQKPKLIRESFYFGKRELTIEYKKTETGGSCSTTCHRIAKYDRYEPAENVIHGSATRGENATKEELRLSRERDMKKLEETEGIKNKQETEIDMEEKHY